MSNIKYAATVTVALIAAGLAGCETPGITNPQAKLAAGEESPGFIDRVSSQNTVSENDAMRGALMLLDGKDTDRVFRQRVEVLKSRGIVPNRWRFTADKPITRGKLAYMIYQVCKVPGGVILALTGPTQRYCLRELQYRGFIASGAWYTPVSGMEFIAVLNRADTYLQTGEVPAIMKTAWSR